MRTYNPKQWFSILFQFHKPDTMRELAPLIGVISLYTLAIAVIEIEFINAHEHNWFKNLNQLHVLVGTALSLLLVFRTNSAYDRWWEGRKLWGSLANSSRNLALKLDSMLPDDADGHRDFFCKAIPLFAETLRGHLQQESTRFALDERDHPELSKLDSQKHQPNMVASSIIQRCYNMQRSGALSEIQLLFLEAQLSDFTNITGACERIKNTPIPFSYSAFIKKFIFIYTITLPLAFAGLLGYLVVPVAAIVFYVLASLELIAEEIEDPFGTDENDLPMGTMAKRIERHVCEILQPNSVGSAT